MWCWLLCRLELSGKSRLTTAWMDQWQRTVTSPWGPFRRDSPLRSSMARCGRSHLSRCGTLCSNASGQFSQTSQDLNSEWSVKFKTSLFLTFCILRVLQHCQILMPAFGLWLALQHFEDCFFCCCQRTLSWSVVLIINYTSIIVHFLILFLSGDTEINHCRDLICRTARV